MKEKDKIKEKPLIESMKMEDNNIIRSKILDNIHQKFINEIWSSAKGIRDKFKSCTQFWIGCYKGFDNVLSKTIATFISKFIAGKYIRNFDWRR